MSLSESPTWKWRLIVRFIGIILLIYPLVTNMMSSNPALTFLLGGAGILMIMVS